jgi:hypothetical protein
MVELHVTLTAKSAKSAIHFETTSEDVPKHTCTE